MLGNDVNPDDFTAANANKMDEGLLVKFYMKSRQDKAASLEAGRPIYKEVEYIEIRVPGQRDVAFAGPADHKRKTRFPKHYEAFKARVEMPVVGTPLSEFPHTNRSMVEELAFFNVKTVEDLVAMSDTHASKFMGMNQLKRIAAEWLEAADETALIAERDAAKDKVTDMEIQMAKMQGQLDAMMQKQPISTAKVEGGEAKVGLEAAVESPLDAPEPEEKAVPLKARRAARKANMTKA